MHLRCAPLPLLHCMAWHIISTRALRDALRLVIKHRFQNWIAEGQSSVAKLQQNVGISSRPFRARDPTSARKSFQYGRHAVHKNVGLSLYFGSFLILEAGVYFFRELERDAAAYSRGSSPIRSGDSPEKGVEWKIRAAVICSQQYYRPLSSGHIRIRDCEKDRSCLVHGLTRLGLCILVITPLLDKSWLQGEKVTLVQALVLCPNLPGVFLSCCVLLLISDRARATDGGASLGLHICAGILVAMGIFTNAFYWTKSMFGLDIRSQEIEVGLGSFQVVLNLGTALLYYAFRYDPSGTYKPSWVNQLG